MRERNTGRTLGWRKGLVLALGIPVAVFLMAEIGLRLILSFTIGPDVLLYGLMPSRQQLKFEKHTVSMHENAQAGYSKYFPHQERVDYDKDTGEQFEVTINAQGFRGEDFPTSKPPGQLRVVSLGASSTFGYHSRDDETYPAFLEQILAKECPGATSVEDINLGVPHLNSAQIVALFRAEGLPLQPDVVTFYEGVNDAAWPSRASKTGGIQGARDRLGELGFLHPMYDFARSRLLIAKLVDQASLRYSKDQIDAALRGKPERLVGNLSALLEETRKRGILLVVGNQQATSSLVEREDLKGLTYAEEQRLVRRKLEEMDSVGVGILAFLHHQVLMETIERWAAENDVPFADVIEATDQDRDVLVSWVHLNGRGNRLVARAFADVIEENACGATRTAELQEEPTPAR